MQCFVIGYIDLFCQKAIFCYWQEESRVFLLLSLISMRHQTFSSNNNATSILIFMTMNILILLLGFLILIPELLIAQQRQNNENYLTHLASYSWLLCCVSILVSPFLPELSSTIFHRYLLVHCTFIISFYLNVSIKSLN